VVHTLMTAEFVLVLFFFSSRRRHTRSYGDWSSDVCSSDLLSRVEHQLVNPELHCKQILQRAQRSQGSHQRCWNPAPPNPLPRQRSEERRVGKECSTRVAAD